MEFRLLGGVEALVNGRHVELGHARQRCVLAVLLVQVNRPLPVDQLIHRVWGDHSPQRARDTLHGYLSRLRSALGDGGPAIVRRPDGYALTTDALDVDLYHFRDLIGRARATDDDGPAADLFEQALGLWHGDPFGTLESPWLDSLRPSLRHERLAAELDRNDIALRCGRHTEQLAGLRAHAWEDPLDERIAGQLMLALCSCGRVAEALDHYRSTRMRLADELGIDPCASLQRLHQRILSADPNLAPHAPGIAASTATRALERQPQPLSTVPSQLPPPVARLAGRTRELEVLNRHLDAVGHDGTTVVVASIVGSAGIGKTTLALSWAQQLREQFPDGQLYVNLRGFDPSGVPMPLHEAVRGVLEGLGVPAQNIPATVHAQIGLYRTLVAGKRLLLVLDNAHDADQIRSLLPGTGSCLVIVTSRRQLSGLLSGGHVRHLALGLLDTDEARQLLAGPLGPDRIAAEPDAAAAIVERCARLPLALSIAAARAATAPHLPLAALADELREERHRIAALSTHDSHHTDLATVFSWSYQALSPASARVFRLLGIHPGPDIGTPAAAALADLPKDSVRAALAELTDANLLHQPTPGRYQFHDLLRVYATERALTEDSDHERDTALRRLLDHYLHTAAAADRLLDPHRDPIALEPPCSELGPPTVHEEALDWFSAQLTVLLGAVRQAAQSGLDGHAWRLAWAMTTYLQRKGHWQAWVATARLALESACRSGNPAGQAHSHHGLGLALAWTRQTDSARVHLDQALDRYTALGDNPGQAHTHRTIAFVLQRTGHYTGALDHAEQTLACYQAADHLAGQASARNAIGWYRAQLGDFQRALADCEQALTLFQKVGNRTGEAYTWDSLGFIYRGLSRSDEAARCYKQALGHFRDLGDRSSEADTLTGLAEAQQALGHMDLARLACQEALALKQELGLPGTDHVRALLTELSASVSTAPASVDRR
ncbi:BTAD domain-containing putative transcriptional regulator [Streptomyces sp. NPDC058268]|uniref:AfsR/SARP family transcriptional regulator n=1 Tax=Streptomyces sp. NPDC058268 TaxID=3346413 RepID=UPI0036E713CB